LKWGPEGQCSGRFSKSKKHGEGNVLKSSLNSGDYVFPSQAGEKKSKKKDTSEQRVGRSLR